MFELTPNRDRLIVSDNGAGMDEDIIERYFTKIGESFYRSSEFLEQDLGFTPVSELGIGFLSCFMIADKVVVETKTDDSSPLLMYIGEISNYFFVWEGKKKRYWYLYNAILEKRYRSKIRFGKGNQTLCASFRVPN
jgi:HSP90 family molecular chaperone